MDEDDDDDNDGRGESCIDDIAELIANWRR
jgi:hypothetical protein